MYESLIDLLKTLSSGPPVIWALLVMLVVAGTGLGLYYFWEGVFRALRVITRRSGRPGERHG